ncbi:MAG: cobalamin B12-binding domain-containing protein [Promethearchaeota archaeon]
MTSEDLLRKLKSSIVEGEPQNAIELMEELIKLDLDAKVILNEAIIKGADEVGILYEKEEYFLADLLMSGDALKAAMKILKPKLSMDSDIKPQKVILIGTVEGDVHDIGKSLVTSLLQGQGFEVIDLGSDVPVETFVQKAKEIKPDIIGLSGLLTMSISKMHETIILLKKANVPSKIIIGGGVVSKQSCAMIGADDCAKDGYEGIKKIKKILSE